MTQAELKLFLITGDTNADIHSMLLQAYTIRYDNYAVIYCSLKRWHVVLTYSGGPPSPLSGAERVQDFQDCHSDIVLHRLAPQYLGPHNRVADLLGRDIFVLPALVVSK